MRAMLNRRHLIFGLGVLVLPLRPSKALAQTRAILSPTEAHEGLLDDSLRVIDVRRHEEWRETGVGARVWPISMHEDRFPERLFAAKALAGDREVGLICAVGGRSGALLQALRRAGYRGYADISEGMLGSRRGPGWLARGLPIVPMDAALAALPAELA